MSNVKWPHLVYSGVVGVPVNYGNMKEADKAWLVEYEKCHTALRDCQLENSFLREDNQRLRHENAFMLRLLNEQVNRGINHEATDKSKAGQGRPVGAEDEQGVHYNR